LTRVEGTILASIFESGRPMMIAVGILGILTSQLGVDNDNFANDIVANSIVGI